MCVRCNLQDVSNGTRPVTALIYCFCIFLCESQESTSCITMCKKKKICRVFLLKFFSSLHVKPGSAERRHSDMLKNQKRESNGNVFLSTSENLRRLHSRKGTRDIFCYMWSIFYFLFFSHLNKKKYIYD